MNFQKLDEIRFKISSNINRQPNNSHKFHDILLRKEWIIELTSGDAVKIIQAE